MGEKSDTVIVSVRLKKEVKEQMQEVCEELGTTMAGAFQMFASAVARGRCIPLELSLVRPITYTSSTIDGKESASKELGATPLRDARRNS